MIDCQMEYAHNSVLERKDSQGIAYRFYSFFVVVGLILFVINDFLSESLLIPNVISNSIKENCLLISMIMLLFGFVLATLNGYFSLSDMIFLITGGVLVLFVEKQYDYLETYSFTSIILSYRLLQRLILFASIRRIDFKKICLIVFIVSSAMMIVVVSQRYLGRVPDLYLYDESRPFKPYRYNMGFKSFGISSIRYINVFFTGMYAIDKYRKKGVPLWLIAVFVLFGAYFFDKTQTRLAYTVILIGAALYILIRKINPNIGDKAAPILRTIAGSAFFVAPIMICLISVFTKPNSPFYRIANKILSGRIRLNYRALTEYPITVRGIVMTMVTNNPDTYFYVDSGFIRSLIEYGVILFVFIISLYAVLSYKAVRKSEKFMVCWLMIICIYNLFNNLFFTLGANSVLLAFWYIQDLHKLSNGNSSLASGRIESSEIVNRNSMNAN